MKFGIRFACGAYIERNIAENFIFFIKTQLPKSLILESIEKKEISGGGQQIIGSEGDCVDISFWVSIDNYPHCENNIPDSILEEENDHAFKTAFAKRGYKTPNTIGSMILFAEEATVTKRDILVRRERKKLKDLFYEAKQSLNFGLRKREHWDDFISIHGPWIGKW